MERLVNVHVRSLPGKLYVAVCRSIPQVTAPKMTLFAMAGSGLVGLVGDPTFGPQH